MRALAAIVVAIIVLAAGSEAMACDVDGFTPSKIGTHTLNITQVFMGFPQWYLWTINLCEPTSDYPPQAASGCGVPGYINEFGDSGNGIACLTSLPTIATTYAKNATTGNLEVMFANDKNWEAKVSVSCGGDSALASTSDIMVTGDHNHLVFEFNLQSNVLCGTPIPPPVPSGGLPTVAPAGCDVGGLKTSKIGTHTLNITQVSQSSPQWYLWTINLCEPTTVHPLGATPCATPGYINEFGSASSDVECLTSWPSISTTYTKSATTGNLYVTFMSDKNWEARVAVSCGGDSVLAPSNDVFVTGDHDHRIFGFTLQSNVICEGGDKKSSSGGEDDRAGKKKSGMTGGGWFALGFFLGGVFCFSATLAFYYFKQRKRGGKELLHSESIQSGSASELAKYESVH